MLIFFVFELTDNEDSASVAGSLAGNVSSDSPSSSAGDRDTDTESLVSSMSRTSVTTTDSSSTATTVADPPAPAANATFTKGTSGTVQPVVTNYFKINKIPNFKLHGYRVDFEPAEDDTRLKKSLMAEHKGALGNFMFDGHMLYTAKIFQREVS